MSFLRVAAARRIAIFLAHPDVDPGFLAHARHARGNDSGRRAITGPDPEEEPIAMVMTPRACFPHLFSISGFGLPGHQQLKPRLTAPVRFHL